jgi:hypothetical protein
VSVGAVATADSVPSEPRNEVHLPKGRTEELASCPLKPISRFRHLLNWRTEMMAARHTTTIRASITAYSTTTPHSSDFLWVVLPWSRIISDTTITADMGLRSRQSSIGQTDQRRRQIFSPILQPAMRLSAFGVLRKRKNRKPKEKALMLGTGLG